MATESFRSVGRGGFEAIVTPDDSGDEWRVAVLDVDGGIIATSSLDWTDLQRLGVFVNRETRRHAKLLQARRGA